ncbi:TonB-dependent receptor domain-containing protein [Sphingobium limneticum]|uniref:TonB-dependent receptor domain-containing protein n=1 Tax=Sphingobium limneticum TaxID=1007511 RepID=UPI003CFC7415
MMALAAFASVGEAAAQRADQNAARTAEDAFGVSYANESVGLYDEEDVRGFSPIDAGNVRIEGLYIDQQANLSYRIVDSSIIRVGLTAIDYPFPAPTGIADFRLPDAPAAWVLSPRLSAGTFGEASIEFDVRAPLVGDALSAAGGFGLYRDNEWYGGTPKSFSGGISFRWRPVPDTEIIPFWSLDTTSSEEAVPTYFTSGAFVPPRVRDRRRYTGQYWATNTSRGSNTGVIARTKLGDWSLAGGVFRSIYAVSRDRTTLWLDVDEAGIGRETVYASPASRYASTSGEMRVSRTFAEGPRLHRFHASVRARDQARLYGEAEAASLSRRSIVTRAPTTEPAFAFVKRTPDDVRQVTGGIAYEGRWNGRGSLNIGIQKTDYRKQVRPPGRDVIISRDRPWLFNLMASLDVASGLSAYAGVTRGLEESEVAPDIAVNRNAAPPALRTRQADAGVRASLGKLQAAVGVFDVRKPYFNLDGADFYRRLGEVRHRGIEGSLSGDVTPFASLVAGAVLLDPRVTGELVENGTIGARPVGTSRSRIVLALDVHPEDWGGSSFDVQVTRHGGSFADQANAVRLPSRSTVALGARHRLRLAHRDVIARVQVTNLFNTFRWIADSSGGLTYNSGRYVGFSLATDLKI